MRRKSANYLSAFRVIQVFFISALLFSANALQAQSGTFDDEDDDSTAIPVEVVKYDEARIMIDGKEFRITPEITIPKNDTIDISVSRLQPNSNVAVHIQKGGITVKKTGFQANEKGELDLEVHTGSKLSGSATVFYFASSGKRVQLDVKIKIE